MRQPPWQTILSLIVYLELNINKLVKGYSQLDLQCHQANFLNWLKYDIALQNIQAQVHSPSARLLANLRNAVAGGNQ